MIFLYCDYEYKVPNNNWKQAHLISCSVGFNKSYSNETLFFDLRNPEGEDANKLRELFKQHTDSILVCFNGNAEVPATLALGAQLPTKLIDLSVEARMIYLTHPKYRLRESGLSSIFEGWFGESLYSKDVRESIILKYDTYDDQQWEQIREYNLKDITALKHLFRTLVHIYDTENINISYDEMINRGVYVKACGTMLHRSKGIPVDMKFLDDVFGNKEQIVSKMCEYCNRETGTNIYVLKKQVNHKDGTITSARYVHNYKNFEKYLVENNLHVDWTKTETDKLSTKEEVFDKFLGDNKYNKFIQPIYETRNTLKALNSVDYRAIADNEGYVHPPMFFFHQKTGRTSPKPKLGFALNLQPWLRRMIKPKEGMCFVGYDWGKQEIAIAASLSEDENFKEDYYGDIYITTAKLAGVVPPEGNKKTHPNERQAFKGVVLGMSYGKQEQSVASDLQYSFGYEESLAKEVANQLFTKRMERYEKYYSWINNLIYTAREDGYYKTLDGWYYFVDSMTSKTQLQNLPMQSNGAAIMRRGYIRCVEAGLDVACSLHDALYCNCEVEDLEFTKTTMEHCMKEAVRDILQDTVTIDNEGKVLMPGERFTDPQKRDIATLKLLKFDKYLVDK